MEFKEKMRGRVGEDRMAYVKVLSAFWVFLSSSYKE